MLRGNYVEVIKKERQTRGHFVLRWDVVHTFESPDSEKQGTLDTLRTVAWCPIQHKFKRQINRTGRHVVFLISKIGNRYHEGLCGNIVHAYDHSPFFGEKRHILYLVKKPYRYLRLTPN